MAGWDARSILLAQKTSYGTNTQARRSSKNGFERWLERLGISREEAAFLLWLATPYCQDELVAEVAREYGMKASVQAIRSNPNFKREVCRLIGQDIRVKKIATRPIQAKMIFPDAALRNRTQ